MSQMRERACFLVQAVALENTERVQLSDAKVQATCFLALGLSSKPSGTISLVKLLL